MLHALPKGCAIDTIAIAEEVARGLGPRDGLHDLLRRPRRCRGLSNIAVHHASALMSQNDEDEEDPKRHSGYHKEIEGNEIVPMVCEKRLPCGRWWFPWAHPVLLHRRFRYVNTELAQFAHDTWGPPGRIGLPQSANEVTDVLGQGRPAGVPG